MNILSSKHLFLAALIFIFSAFANPIQAQSYVEDMKRQSARSDKLTGGTIEKTRLEAGVGNLKITINVPAFQMTLWQNGKEVKTYPIGVGLIDFPIYVGSREATDIIWNPSWIPPASEWVEVSKKVRPGEIILPTDPRNPLGKIKIPLGLGFLIHQAKGVGDMGNLVSHGCVRVLKNDLYDLSEKIVAAYSLPVSPQQIAQAKATLETLVAELNPPIPVVITYDTHVIENNQLHIYPDVYERRMNTPEKLRDELESNGIDTRNLTDAMLKQMLMRAANKKQFVVSVENIKKRNILGGGRIIPVVTGAEAPVQRKTVRRKR